jgi:PAS domain S-box-containing protein
MLVDDEAIITDVRGRILEVNERAEHLLGYERKNLVNGDLDRFLTPVMRKRSK